MYDADKAIFLLKDSENLEKIPMKEYDSEELLQALIEKHPELLAGDQINPDEPMRWILVKREAGVPGGDQQGDRWSIDHLLLDQNAIPTFVETKRSSDTRIRREVVGQMLDYSANAQRYWPSDHIRSMTTAQHGGENAADEAIIKLLGLESAEEPANDINNYWVKVDDNLRHGHVRLMFVADRLPAELRRIIEFLNEQMSDVEVLGVELTQYVGSKIKALVPRVIGQTEIIRQRKQTTKPSKRPITQREFLENCPENARDFFSQAITESIRRGMQIYWGTSGFSLRARGSDDKLISLFYGFPSGGSSENCAIIQGYTGNIENISYREQIRQRLLQIPRTYQSGQYTIVLDIIPSNLESAWDLLKVVWDINQELSGKTHGKTLEK